VNDPVRVVRDMHRNSEFTLIFLEKWRLFLEIQRIPLVLLLSIGKFHLTGQASCLSLSCSYWCWFVKHLSCWAGVQCVCVGSVFCWTECIFSVLLPSMCHGKKSHRMYGKKYIMLVMPC